MSEDYVLELEHIRKEYPGVVALKDVTLQLRRGEVLGLIGENGAGKSTLIKCCSGAVIPTSGTIRVNGKEFDRMHGLDWYDYGARFHDPATGRWMCVDPHLEKYYPFSPYLEH